MKSYTSLCGLDVGSAKKSDTSFPYNVSSSAQLSLTSFETILLDCIVTAVISVCIKKTSKQVNFCAAVLILKMEENTQHFWHIILYYFRKGRKATEMQEEICAVCGEGAVTDQMCQKWFVKFLGTIDILGKQFFAVRRKESYTGKCLAAPLPSTHCKPIAGDSRHTPSIQINKVYW